jgi:hypothetical protein
MRRGSVAAAALAVGICCLIAFTRPVGADYGNLDCHLRYAYCDDAQPAIDALIHGDLHRFFATQPLMGPVTEVLRAPFAALAGFDEYDPKLVYDLGSLACLLLLAAVALRVAAVVRDRGGPLWQQGLTAAILLLNPMVFRALAVGHPEEIATSALCVAVVLALLKDRYVLSGLLLGAAVASKVWALLIAPAVLLAPGNARAVMRIGLAAGAVVLVLYAPLAIGDEGRLRGSVAAVNKLGSHAGGVTSANVWWFVAARKAPFERATGVVDGRIVMERDVGFTIDKGVARISHTLVLLVAALLGLLWSRSDERRRRPETLLLLFALIFLLRCVLDPGDTSYYHLPAVVSLASYEGIACRRPPWASGWVIGWLTAMSWAAAHIHSDAGFGAFYLAWALPTVAALAVWLFKPSLFRVRSGASGLRLRAAD